MLEGRIGEEQRRGELHGQRLRHRVGRHAVETLGERRSELSEGVVPHLRSLAMHHAQRRLELGEILRATRSEVEPCLLDAGEQSAGVACQRLRADDVGVDGVCGRNQR